MPTEPAFGPGCEPGTAQREPRPPVQREMSVFRLHRLWESPIFCFPPSGPPDDLHTCVSLRAPRVLLLVVTIISFSVSLAPPLSLHWKDSLWAQAAGQHDPGGSSPGFSFSGTEELSR